MIISATRIRTSSGHRPLADHVWRAQGNEEVIIVRGSELDLPAMVATARLAGMRYAIRHWHVSPGEPMTNDEALDIVQDLAAEFRFDAETAVIVRHEKPRRVPYDPMTAAQGAPVHWHVLVPEVDAATLRCLDSSWMRPRQERIARVAELRLQHRVIKGRFNTSVLRALKARGEAKAALQLEEAGIIDGRPVYAAYTSTQRRLLERKHATPRGSRLDLPSLVRLLQEAWVVHRGDRETLDQTLRRIGLRIRRGCEEPSVVPDRHVLPAPPTRSTAWVVDAYDGRTRQAYVLGALHVLVQERRSAVERRLAQLSPPLPRPRDARRKEEGWREREGTGHQGLRVEGPERPDFLPGTPASA